MEYFVTLVAKIERLGKAVIKRQFVGIIFGISFGIISGSDDFDWF